MKGRELAERIQKRALRASVPLPSELAEKLSAYYDLLSKWNSHINLTSFDLKSLDRADTAIDKLLVEPLLASRHVAGARVMVDVGSGGGSPAIPIALACPQLSAQLVEAKTRKAVFLREAVRELNLTAVSVHTERYESLLAWPQFHEAADLLTIRAVRVEPKTLLALQSFLRTGGRLFLFKGANGAEGKDLLSSLTWEATYPLLPSQSRLVILKKRLRNSFDRQLGGVTTYSGY